MDKSQHPKVIRTWTVDKTRKSTRQGLSTNRRQKIRVGVVRKPRPRNKA